MKSKHKSKSNVQKFISSNGHFIIEKSDDSIVIRLYAQAYDTSIYDLAETLYNDCIKAINISTVLIYKVVFYHSRNMVRTYRIKNSQSLEDLLKDLCRQLWL